MAIFKRKKQRLSRREMNRALNETQISNDSYRRNRTITNSVYKSNLDLNTPRTHVHHLSLRRRKVFSTLVIILLSIAITCLIIINLTAGITVSTATKPTIKLEQSRYINAIQDYLDANPLERLSFFLDQSRLTAFVSSKLPEVLSVKLIGMKNVGQTDYRLTMRQPIAGWVINSKQYYVDDKGVSFEINYFLNPSVQIIDNTGTPIQAGTMSVSKRLLGFVGLVVSEANKYGYQTEKAILPAGTMREVDINITDIKPTIKLTVDRAVGEQVEDMSRAINYFSSHALDPAYIDVRVSNKAFYR